MKYDRLKLHSLAAVFLVNYLITSGFTALCLKKCLNTWRKLLSLMKGKYPWQQEDPCLLGPGNSFALSQYWQLQQFTHCTLFVSAPSPPPSLPVYFTTSTSHTLHVQKPNSWTYNFFEVFRHDLVSSPDLRFLYGFLKLQYIGKGVWFSIRFSSFLLYSVQ